MPLTSKGTEIMAALTKEYGSEKGKSVFYAGKNSGKFTGVDENCTDDEKFDEIACRADALSARFDALVFEQPAQSVKDYKSDDLRRLADVMTSGFPAQSVNQPLGDSDAGQQRRKFPGYTTDELEKAVAAGSPRAAEMQREIEDRKSGKSVALVTPQVVPPWKTR